MNAFVGVGLVLANLIPGLFGKKEQALIIYITLSIISPVINIFGLKVSYEILGFFPIVILFIIFKKKLEISKTSKYLFVYLSIFIASTLLSNLYNSPKNEPMAIFGVFRMIVLYLMFINTENSKAIIHKSLNISLFANAIAMFIQLTLPSAVEIFNTLYVKESSTAISWFLKVGRFTRLTGTFSNVAPAALFLLLVIAINLVEYSETQSRSSTLILIISIVCGIATASKTFYVGFIILVICNSFFNVILMNNKYKRRLDLVKPLIILCIIVVGFVFIRVTEDKLYTKQYISNLNFTNIFSSRYNNESGNLAEAVAVFKDNLLIGVGATRINNEFVGDSLYVTILHGTGILGFVLITMLFFRLIMYNFRTKNKLNLLLIICVLMAGFAIPTVFNILGAITLSYIYSNQKTRQSFV